jgi:regulator of protease activity HflC (stomatin/prohibitin superfamily)
MPRKRPRKRATNQDPSVIVRVNIISIILILVFTGIGVAVTVRQQNPAGVFVGAVIGLVLAQSPKIAKQWERAVVLRLGKYVGLRGPGLFWIVPLVDTVAAWIDQRVITTNFKAEETLTLDTVPVNVDAVLFWPVGRHRPVGRDARRRDSDIAPGRNVSRSPGLA